MLMKDVCILGLGYVGYPLAVLAQEKGFDVKGLDLDQGKLDLIAKGVDPVTKEENGVTFPAAKDDPSSISGADVILVCVPTPVDETKMPDLSPVKGACEAVAKNLDPARKPVVIVESTINPGVMEDVVRPLFESHGRVVGEDVFLAHCPERINPGDPKWHVGNIPRVLGAFTKEGLDKAYGFYTSILEGEVKKMSNIRTAEACKVVENAFRDINIAFVNELARSFEMLDIDVVEVIDGAATKPFAFMAHYPGCGVGGHCIPVDPYYLIERAKTKGFDHRFLKLAREINESMPEHAVSLLADALNERRMSVNGTTVGLLGLSYKADVGDDRESPSYRILEFLKKKGALVVTHDPHLACDEPDLEELQKRCDVLLVATDHKEYRDLDLSKVKVLVDGRNMFARRELPGSITYRGIGRH
ncbi:MAG: nucleotide sugar dehydrogenase [Candidatus Woesearchaeota archaeon]